jgi:enoyl-CoA hydratase
VSDAIEVQQDGNIAEVVFDRPPVNAVSSGVYRELAAVFGDLSSRTDVDVVVVRSGNPRIFCAGADIKEVQAIVESETTAADEQRQALAREAYDRIVNCAQPTIAVVNGPALGAGAVLAACCDVRYASASATIGVPEIKVGRCGGGRHLMRLVSQGVVREMYFTGDALPADEAFRVGLFNRVFPEGKELEAARELARRIGAKSPTALRLAKEALNRAEGLPLDEGYAVEQEYTIRLGRSPDAVEAARAFLEKRDPVWVRP